VSGRTRLLGVDTGAVRIGLAISNPERTIAFPLTQYVRGDRDQDAEYFRRLTDEEEIGRIVVGLPLHTDGREGKKAEEAREYGALLAEATALPVVHWDERFTTVEAESHLWGAGLTHQRRKARRDQVAAQIMLQGYIEAGCPE
jgi:putative Holliday junction resolvase